MSTLVWLFLVMLLCQRLAIAMTLRVLQAMVARVRRLIFKAMLFIVLALKAYNCELIKFDFKI